MSNQKSTGTGSRFSKISLDFLEKMPQDELVIDHAPDEHLDLDWSPEHQQIEIDEPELTFPTFATEKWIKYKPESILDLIPAWQELEEEDTDKNIQLVALKSLQESNDPFGYTPVLKKKKLHYYSPDFEKRFSYDF